VVGADLQKQPEVKGFKMDIPDVAIKGRENETPDRKVKIKRSSKFLYVGEHGYI
jgi:hypothetical protein